MRKNKLPNLANQLALAKGRAISSHKVTAPQGFGSTSETPRLSSAKLGRLTDLRTLSASSKLSSTGLRFGSPSSKASAAPRAGVNWSNLLKQAASGGLASAFGGSLSSLGGLGSLISGITSLFGGGSKNPLPALVQFQLPASQDLTAYLPAASSSERGAATGSPAAQGNSQGVYASPGQLAGGPFQYQSAQIAQAVKHALLNSSTLSDVISEI